jgi:putative hemolysin
METDERVTACLRLATELLQPRQHRKNINSPKAFAQLPLSTLDSWPSLKSDLRQQLMMIEDCQVVCNEAYAVYIAPFDRLGVLMDAIGQAREYTFREAGEGTGNSSDVDQFDPYYLHVFVWDKHRLRIVGGYRLGRVNEIVARCGIDGLYARTLYSLDLEYLKNLGNPLELGRSFVHPDYQRKPAALDLLWRGIGRYVASHPEFDTLFGAVSISNEHSDMARALISECMLESFQAEQKFLNNVEPVAPLSVSAKVWSREMLATLCHVPLVNKLVGCCDPGKALPILLRHYLSLNGKFVCFSVNKAFNNSLDGLILVDLSKVPEKYMKRYLGAEGLEHYQKHWKNQVQADNNSA